MDETTLNERIEDCFRYFLKCLGPIEAYNKEWSDEYCRKQAVEALEKCRDYLLPGGWNEIIALPTKALLRIGFRTWDDSGLLLIPLWLWSLVPDGMELTCINGKKAVKGKDDINLDHRSGCLAYGFVPKEVTNHPNL
jgi:hypothetical protein